MHIKTPSPKLDEKGVLCIQVIVGALLFYVRGVDNKLLVALNSIDTQQANMTKATNEAVTTLLDYMDTYPDGGILYHVSDMILAIHSDSGFQNITKGCSRAGEHIFSPKMTCSHVGMGQFLPSPRSSNLS